MRPTRQIAFGILQRWGETSHYAEDLISREAAKHKLAPPDRAFVNALVLGVLRNLSLLDHWIDKLRGRGKTKDDLRDALRLGLFQLICMRVPDHAAVNETVGLLRKHARPVANAILRRAARESETLAGEIATLPDDLRYSIPEFLIARWNDRFGEAETRRLCEWNNQPAELIIRANGLRPDSLAIISASDNTTAIPGCDGFFKVDELPEEWIADGLAYVQDAATGLAPRLLAPQPGQRVLDACAAPGGKTAMLAQAMENQGELIATDRSEKRCTRLSENLQRLGVKCAKVSVADWGPEQSGQDELGKFDAILLDVPCSNTGVLRRRVDVRWRLFEGFAEHQKIQQRAILDSTAPLLRAGGAIVYSTCSIEAEENEELVGEFLADHPEFTLEATATSLPHRDGKDGAFAARLIHKT